MAQLPSVFLRTPGAIVFFKEKILYSREKWRASNDVWRADFPRCELVGTPLGRGA